MVKLKNKNTNVEKEVDEKMATLMIGTGDWEAVKKRINLRGTFDEPRQERNWFRN